MNLDDLPDPDDEARRDALDIIVRRALVWALPLTLAAALVVALGIPWWIGIGAVVVVLAIVVFEIDF
jgi:membrane protein YdbS with pleckstrin-like domain